MSKPFPRNVWVQVEGDADEELNCEVLAVSTQAKVVVLVERAR